MVLLKRRAVLLAKLESTYGDDSTPAAADDAILTIDINVNRNFEPVTRDVQIGSMTRKQSVSGKRFVEVTFQTELVGSGAAATAPRLGALLQACAFGETVTSPTDVTYAPVSTSLKSITLYVYLDGLRHIITGAVGTFKLTATAGMPAMLEWTFRGMYAAKTATALASPTFETTVDNIPVVKSASLTLNSDSDVVVNEFTFDLGNTIAQRPSVNATYAIAGFHITDRQPVATIDPEVEITSTYDTLDFETDVLATPRQLTLTIGSTTGNRCDVTIPKFNITGIEYGDREGTLIETLTGQCADDDGTGDNEVTFAFD